MVKNRIAMAPNIKCFALSTWAINDDVSLHGPEKYWYVTVFVIVHGPGQQNFQFLTTLGDKGYRIFLETLLSLLYLYV